MLILILNSHLGPLQLAKIPGLNKLLKYGSHKSAIQLDIKPQDFQYRPLVDEILRSTIGLDFQTALSVQGYMCQLLEAGKGGVQSEQLKANRRQLRDNIVKRAQEIWVGMKLDGRERMLERSTNPKVCRWATAKRIIVFTRNRWAPASRLPSFLFPARLLSSSDSLLPDDPNARWLKDPTIEFETSRDVIRASSQWIDQKAADMLQKLVVYMPGKEITTWMKAGQEWHIQRLTQDLYSGKFLNLEYGGSRLGTLDDQPTATKNRLEVIAKKLRIDPLFPVGTLTDHEKRVAEVCFTKIIRQRCCGCPFNNFLILPGGLEGVVRHFSDHHPHEFWLNDQWTLRG